MIKTYQNRCLKRKHEGLLVVLNGSLNVHPTLERDVGPLGHQVLASKAERKEDERSKGNQHYITLPYQLGGHPLSQIYVPHQKPFI